MFSTDPNYILIYLGIFAIIAELILGVSTGFDLFLIGVIFIIGGAVGIATNSLNAAFLVIITLSILYVFLLRAFIKDRLNIKTQKTSVEELIGKKGIVVKQILPNEPGQIKVEGEIWRAEASITIDKDSTVTINSVTGVTLAVSKEEK